MKEALAAAGVEITLNREENYDLAIHIMRPDYFKPIPGTRNILFTTTEYSEPTNWSESVKDAALLVVPCSYSAEVCRKHYSGRVEVCPEGIDPVRFPFHERTEPAQGGPFQFLFVGNGAVGTAGKTANADRKGLDIMLSAWKNWFTSGTMPPNAQLYVKTTDMPGTELQYMKPVFETWQPTGQVMPRGFGPSEGPALPGIIFDNRELSLSALVELYNGAHCFVLPSRGEGWGLTLTDAMATGLPSIWTHWSAMIDYADESIGYPIPEAELDVRLLSPSNYKPDGEELPLFGAEIKNDPSLFGRMRYIYHHYDEALARGRAASARMHSRYTWRQAAERFIEICEEVCSRN
jgi:glycosyltransferase involved in cell wall biosynthesis